MMSVEIFPEFFEVPQTATTPVCCGYSMEPTFSISMAWYLVTKEGSDGEEHNYESAPCPIWTCSICGSYQVAFDMDHWAMELTIKNNPLLSAIVRK